MAYKIIIVIAYLFLLLIIPIILEYLADLTTRKNRREQIIAVAGDKAKESSKRLIVFNSSDSGCFDNNSNFRGDIADILKSIKDNSCVIVMNSVLECIDSPENILKEAHRVSGGDLYITGHERSSLRPLFDNKFKRTMNNAFYLPEEEIVFVKLNHLQLRLQSIYSKLFMIVPIDILMSQR